MTSEHENAALQVKAVSVSLDSISFKDGECFAVLKVERLADYTAQGAVRACTVSAVIETLDSNGAWHETVCVAISGKTEQPFFYTVRGEAPDGSIHGARVRVADGSGAPVAFDIANGIMTASCHDGSRIEIGRIAEPKHGDGAGGSDDTLAALRDQTRAIDDLVLSNNRILDELIGQRQLQPSEEGAVPATYLNGQPR